MSADKRTSHSARVTCGACRAIGHTVGRCVDSAAIDYWTAAARKQRTKAAEHLNAAFAADLRGSVNDAAWNRREATIAMDAAKRCDRKRAKVEALQTTAGAA